MIQSKIGNIKLSVMGCHTSFPTAPLFYEKAYVLIEDGVARISGYKVSINEQGESYLQAVEVFINMSNAVIEWS